jgi:hypothetical protein
MGYPGITHGPFRGHQAQHCPAHLGAFKQEKQDEHGDGSQCHEQRHRVNTLIASPPPGAPVPPILPPNDRFVCLDREKFHASFAGDVSAEEAAFMANSQVPWGVDALGGVITEPAWRTKPSWYLVTTEDRMIPPQAQRTMSGRAGSTTTEVAGSHAIYVSQPSAVAALIKQVAAAVTAQQ